MLGLEARVAVNAVTAVLVFCECSSSVHLFQINTEMPSSRFKHCNDSLTNEGRRQRKCRTNAQRDLICRAPGTDL